jgi:hypothetical protein
MLLNNSGAAELAMMTFADGVTVDSSTRSRVGGDMSDTEEVL